MTNSSQCDNGVLSTYSGSANLTANWQGNPITVTWYNGDTQYDSNQCTYGGDLTMPSSIPQKTGYTFRGWRVKQADTSCFAASVCSLTGSQVNGLTGSDYGYNSHDGQDAENTSTYGLTSTGSWAVEFTNGGVARGIASCNNTDSNTFDTVMTAMQNGTMTEGQVVNAVYGSCSSDAIKPGNTFSNTSNLNNGDQYCWCKMTSYTPNNGSACNVASPSWVFVIGFHYGSASECADGCASGCAYGIASLDFFRRAVFGVSQ